MRSAVMDIHLGNRLPGPTIIDVVAYNRGPADIFAVHWETQLARQTIQGRGAGYSRATEAAAIRTGGWEAATLVKDSCEETSLPGVAEAATGSRRTLGAGARAAGAIRLAQVRTGGVIAPVALLRALANTVITLLTCAVWQAQAGTGRVVAPVALLAGLVDYAVGAGRPRTGAHGRAYPRARIVIVTIALLAGLVNHPVGTRWCETCALGGA